jgi:hypothetical protein
MTYNDAIWHTLRRLYEAQHPDEPITFNTYQPLNKLGSSPSAERILDALHQLCDEGIVALSDEGPIDEMLVGMDGPELLVTSRIVVIRDKARLAAAYNACNDWQKQQAQLAPITVAYDGKGHGTINGHDFELSHTNKFLFGLLYKHANEWVPQAVVFKTLRIDAPGKQAAMALSDKVGNLRKALGLTTSHIKVSKKQVMLNAEIVE